MKVSTLACTALNNMLATVTHEEFQAGDPEGLIHWDGQSWKWVAVRGSWTTGIDRVDGNWVALDASGALRFLTSDLTEIATSAIAPYAWDDFCVKGSEVFAVGMSGAFARFSQENWHRIENDTNVYLHSVATADSAVFACGDKGVLLEYNNSICRRVDLGCEATLTSVRASDGNLFAAGFQEESGVLLEVSTSKAHPLPTRPAFITVVSPIEVYIVDWLEQAWIWDGKFSIKLPLGGLTGVSSINRLGDTVIFGGRDAITIKEGATFKKIPLNLDSSRIAPE